MALALALAAAKAPITLVTVRHHERPRDATDAEIGMVRALAESLGMGCMIEEVPCDTACTEAAMRRARYAVLASVAVRENIGFVATGHHADDQLESVLLALIRGAGVNGLRGIAPRRRLMGSDVRLIRPMLGVRRGDAEAICREAGRSWVEDPTNADTRRARAALRARVIPELEAIRPGVAVRLNRTTGVLRDAAAILRELIDCVLAEGWRGEGTITWDRATLRAQRRAVVAGVIRAAAGEHAGMRGRDALGHKALAPIVRAIRDDGTDPRAFDLRAGMSVRVTAHEVAVAFGV